MDDPAELCKLAERYRAFAAVGSADQREGRLRMSLAAMISSPTIIYPLSKMLYRPELMLTRVRFWEKGRV